MNRTVRPGNPGLRAASSDDDSYLNKLVKYVPVEGLAPFIPIATLAMDGWKLWLTFAVALVIGVLLIAVQARSQAEPPRGWFWPFVVVAFCAWSVGASEEFRSLLNVSSSTGGWLLALTAATLPAADSGLEKLWPR
jgi:hypothetical protein